MAVATPAVSVARCRVIVPVTGVAVGVAVGGYRAGAVTGVAVGVTDRRPVAVRAGFGMRIPGPCRGAVPAGGRLGIVAGHHH
ncbi:MAG TPA: hypothetical protein VFP54_09335 [Acidimicrobiales bacterium]|nr:hypothetical protein [Acidimicrobiales bacterium]